MGVRLKEQRVHSWTWKQKSKKNMLGVTYKFQLVFCHSSAQCREGGDKSLSHFGSDADTNRVTFHVTDAAHTGPC